MPTPATLLRLVLVLVLVVVAGCRSDPIDPESLPPISIDEPPTSSSSSSSSSTTATTTTSSVPVSVVEVSDADDKPDLDIPTEWDSDLDEIFGRYQLYRDAVVIAAGPPRPSPDYPPIEDLGTTRLAAEFSEQMQGLLEAGEVYVLPEDTISEHIVRLPNPAVLTKEEGREVIIQDCWVEDAEMHDLEGQVLQVFYTSTLLNVTMRVEDGEWRVAGLTSDTQESSGYQECVEYIEQLSQ